MKICSACDISPENIMAFGDDFADIGMLELCGMGIAMGNAIQEVKDIADIVSRIIMKTNMTGIIDMTLHYRKAALDDLEEIYSLVSHAIDVMISQNILQWDEIYPTKEDYRQDISRNELYVGLAGERIAVVFTLNQECNEQYQNGRWERPDIPYYIVHRLCVHPDFQNQGIAKHTLLYIESELIKKDIHAIRLDAFCNNPYSLKLYDSLHYSRVGYADWRKGRFYLMEKYI